jgi:hypothetical protein
MSLGLASYQVMVRHTTLGIWLHGRRDRSTFNSGTAVIRRQNLRISREWFRRASRWVRTSGTAAGLLVLSVAVPFGCARDPQADAGSSRAIATIKNVGGSFERKVRADGRPTVTIDLAGKAFTDSDLAQLTRLKNVDCLILRGTMVTDAGLALLKSAGKLRSLDLDGCPITDAGLAQLGELTSLRGLYLAGTKVTDAGIAELQSLTKLSALGLRGTEITDASLTSLLHLDTLRLLDLERTRVTSAGVARLRKEMPRIRIVAAPGRTRFL